MSDTKEIPLEDFIGSMNDAPEPGHDAWVRKKVQATLDKKERGEAVYTPLGEVMEQFGFNAR